MAQESSVEFIQSLSIDEKLLQNLKSLTFSSSGTRRICLHPSENAPLHVMLVEILSENKFPSHYHSDSDEVIVAIQGQLEIIIGNEGLHSSTQKLVLGVDDGNTRAMFLPKFLPHSTQPIDGNAIYLEIKLGPFNKDSLVQLEEIS